MTRTTFLALAFSVAGCSEFDMVSVLEPHVPGSAEGTDAEPPHTSTPNDDPSEPDGGSWIGGRLPGGNLEGNGDLPEGGGDDPEGDDPEGDVPAGDGDDPEAGADDPEGGVDDPEGGADDPEGDGDVPEGGVDPGEDDSGLVLNGCTPGYWKQDQHLDSWGGGLTPETLFVDVFGEDAFPGLTLFDVLELGEGDLDALGRHSVAALLNALAGDVDYPITDTEVIDA